jgi:hypothetical protein
MVMRSLEAARAERGMLVPANNPNPAAAPCLRKSLRLTADLFLFINAAFLL